MHLSVPTSDPFDARPVLRADLQVRAIGQGSHRRIRLTDIAKHATHELGLREYEFASIGLFVSAGDPRALRSILLAYGYAAAALEHALQNRLMAMALLHRYSNLPWYLQRLPLPDAQRLEQLAAHWWNLSLD